MGLMLLYFSFFVLLSVCISCADSSYYANKQFRKMIAEVKTLEDGPNKTYDAPLQMVYYPGDYTSLDNFNFDKDLSMFTDKRNSHEYFYLNANFNSKVICDGDWIEPTFYIDVELESENSFDFCQNDSLIYKKLQKLTVVVRRLQNVPKLLDSLEMMTNFRVYDLQNLLIYDKKAREQIGLSVSFEPDSLRYFKTHDCSTEYHYRDSGSRSLPAYVCNVALSKMLINSCEFHLPACDMNSLLARNLKIIETSTIINTNMLELELFALVPIIHWEIGTMCNPDYREEISIGIAKYKDKLADKISMKDRYKIHNNYLLSIILHLLYKTSDKPIMDDTNNAILCTDVMSCIFAYIDNFENFKKVIENEYYFEELMILKDFISFGTLDKSDEDKFLLSNEWYSSIYSKEDKRIEFLNHLKIVLSRKENLMELSTDEMRDIPTKEFDEDARNGKPKRFHFKVKVDEKTLSEFMQTYFLAYFQDPRLGESYQEQIMIAIFNGVKDDFFKNESKENLACIENAFLHGKTWYIEEFKGAAFYANPIIDVKSSFYVKEKAVIAIDKIDRTLDIWERGHS